MSEKIKSAFSDWEVGELIGSGASGKVYKITKSSSYGVSMTQAVKIINIPQTQSKFRDLLSEGLDTMSAKTHIRFIVDNIVSEIRLIQKLSFCRNVIQIYDFNVEVNETDDYVSYEIQIRMELLSSLKNIMSNKSFSEKDIIKIGIDVCNALVACEDSNPPIIHRDIKPDNILISESGDYKLADFGEARELEKTSGNFSNVGTPNYIAPEVVKGSRYDKTVDFYSLGIVLYQMLNNNRLPFYPTEGMFSASDRETAIQRRMRGEVFPPPCNASLETSEIILKACSFDPSLRYQSAKLFKEALEAIVSTSKKVDSFDTTGDETMRVRRVGEGGAAVAAAAATPNVLPTLGNHNQTTGQNYNQSIRPVQQSYQNVGQSYNQSMQPIQQSYQNVGQSYNQSVQPIQPAQPVQPIQQSYQNIGQNYAQSMRVPYQYQSPNPQLINNKEPGDENGKVAMVLGIFSLVFLGFVLPLGIAGLITANLSNKKQIQAGLPPLKYAKAGKITSIISIAFSVFIIICIIYSFNNKEEDPASTSTSKLSTTEKSTTEKSTTEKSTTENLEDFPPYKNQFARNTPIIVDDFVYEVLSHRYEGEYVYITLKVTLAEPAVVTKRFDGKDLRIYLSYAPSNPVYALWFEDKNGQYSPPLELTFEMPGDSWVADVVFSPDDTFVFYIGDYVFNDWD